MTEEKEKKQQEVKVDLALLEDDDEFEEFPAEDWGKEDEEKADINVWEDNWDDDNTEDDFSQQLRAQLEKRGHRIKVTDPNSVSKEVMSS